MGAKYFGTDGIRDLANAGSLRPSKILRISLALGALAHPAPSGGKPRLGLAGDTRISLSMIRSALTAGFTSLGWDVLDFGVLPTPGLAHLVRARGLDLGIMISASHNSMEDNGIKVFDPEGFKLPDKLEDAVEQRADDPDWEPELPTGARLGRCCLDGAGLEEYMTSLLAPFKGLSLKDLKVAVDCANGAAWKLAPEIVTRLGAKAVVMANDPDGTNINRDCGSVHPGKLAELVRSEACDAGFALDGDGDRCCFADASGKILSGDHLMALLALRMQEQGRLVPGVVVATILSNLGLEKALDRAGIRLDRTDVGDRHVTRLMREIRSPLGGEQSGHIIFGEENHYTGDGVFTALKVLQVMAETGRSLADLASVMRPYPQAQLSVDVPRKPPMEDLPGFSSAMREAKERLRGEGRVIARYSGTERKARVMVEGRDEAEVHALAARLAQVLKEEIER